MKKISISAVRGSASMAMGARRYRAFSMALKPSPEPLAPKPSFHKRPLPPQLIPLSSQEGKRLFREALDAGGMESYFPLAEQFITQSDPSFCSVSTLAMVLNALNFDLKRVWKGPWRWVTEEMLQCESQAVCGHSIAKVQQSGLSFLEFESLARCHGVRISSHRVSPSTPPPNRPLSAAGPADSSLDRFREVVRATAASAAASSFVVVNFSRKALGQTGDGHYSPLAGYHAERDLVLVLDVARFKYPPYWVSLAELWASMALPDKATGLSRGYFLISGWERGGEEGGRGETEGLQNCPGGIKSWVDFDPRPHNTFREGECGEGGGHSHQHAHGHHHESSS